MDHREMFEKLSMAVHRENLEEIKILLAAGAPTNYTDDWNRETLLHHTKSVVIAKQLLLNGADVNLQNKYRETPLDHAVSYYKSLEFVKLLLDNGAQINCRNRKGNTPLNLAVFRIYKKKLDLVTELLKRGADIFVNNRVFLHGKYYHNSPLDSAVDDLECAKIFIKYISIRHFYGHRKVVLDLQPYGDSPNYSELKLYQDACNAEIQQMNRDVMEKWLLPLYAFLTKNFPQILLRNNTLAKKLTTRDYSVQYPIYHDVILEVLKPFTDRIAFMLKLDKMQIYNFQDIHKQQEGVAVKKILLDIYSVHHIAKYLSNNDLANLIVAFESLTSANDTVDKVDVLCEASTSSLAAKRLKLQ